jgi:Tol biopolymer transport system component
MRGSVVRTAHMLAVTLAVAACGSLGGIATAFPGPSPQASEQPGAVGAQGALAVPREERWGIYQLDLETQAVKLLLSSPTRMSYLRLDPLGNRLVFSQTLAGDANEQEEILAVGADGSGLRRLTDNVYWDLYPVWSPDGETIAFLSWRAQSLGIFAMSSDGGQTSVLLDSPSQEADIDWVGDVIVFTKDSRIWAMRPDGGDARRLTDPPRAGEWGAANLPFGDYDPRISPDGSQVVFERLLADDSPHGNYDIFVVDITSPEETRLTATGFSQGLPSWSHSGHQLVYVVSAIGDVGQYDLYVMNADGTDIRNITPGYFPAQFLCHWAVFSADDSSLYFIGEWWQ